MYVPSYTQIQTSNNLNSQETLSKKAVAGGTWVIILRIANRGLDFVRTIILARLLSPMDFGLLGIALLSMSMLDTFSQTGLKVALIQKKENIESYLDTAWTISVLRGLALFTLLFASAPMIAIFFNSPQATAVIRVIALSTLLTGSQNIGILYFQKELDFKKYSLYQISITVAHVFATITLALILRNVWALVLGSLFANVVGAFLSYAIHHYRPRFAFEKEKALELLSFGKWILFSTIVVFFARQGDDLFLGKILGVTALGFYQMAFFIGNIPSSEITGTVSTVVFPAYAKLIATPQKLNTAYLRTLSLIFLISFPLAGGICILAPNFTSLFLGEKWLPIVLPLQILAISGLIRSVVGTGGSLFNAIGKPRFDFKMNLWRLFITFITIYPLTKLWGISGTSLAVLLGLLASSYFWLQESIRNLKISLNTVFVMLLPPLISTFSMLLAIFFVILLLSPLNYPLLSFFVSSIFGISVYIGVILAIDRVSTSNIHNEIKFIFKNLRI